MPRRRALITTTSKIASLCRSGLISAAMKLFDAMPERDTVAWNAMLTGCSSCLTYAHHSLSLFSAMISSGTSPDSFSFTAVLASAADLRDLRSGTKFHALVLRLGFRCSLPVCNALIDMYGKCSCPTDATRVFEEMEQRNEVSWCSLLHGYVSSCQLSHAHRLFREMPVRNVIAWNILIVGYMVFGEAQMSLALFKEMHCSGVEGDVSTFASIVNACSELPDACFGRMIHACVIRRGWNEVVEVCNSLLSFYTKMGLPNDASKIFELMETRSLISWNAMIDACMRTGDVDGALLLFQRAPEANVVSWTTMIGGFSRNGHCEQALALFVDMTRNLLRPDDFTFGAVLHACAILTVLGVGRMVHGCVIHSGFGSYVYVANGLMNMYAKCGDIDGSRQVFKVIANKDLVSWNAMLIGYALHGWASKALEVYEDMLAHGVLPDKVTYIGLLVACSHSGLINKGRAFFEEMEAVHGLRPDEDHVTCVVDLLGRAGHLAEASELLNGQSRMACWTTTNSNEALLSACAVRANVRIGKKVGEELMSVEPWKEVGYVMLSNMYCFSGRWKEAEDVRRAMVQQGVKKAPGCSWIEVRDRVVLFVTGNQSLEFLRDVHLMLGSLECEMKNPNVVSFK